MKQKKRTGDYLFAFVVLVSDPGEIRTLDPMIKSHLLYQLASSDGGLKPSAQTPPRRHQVNCAQRAHAFTV
ncbi:MAG: hypothetical protein ACRDCN_10645, partial [Tannerellaceae bacterium]